MPKSLLERWVRVFLVLQGILHICFVSLLSILSSSFMFNLEKGSS